MDVCNFQECCGAKILYSFYLNIGHTKKSVDSFLKDAVKQYKGMAFLIIILDRSERRSWHKIMVKNDFHILSEGKNINNNSHLTLYVRNNPVLDARLRKNYDEG